MSQESGIKNQELNSNHNSLFMIHNSRGSGGLTLVELIVILAIVAILILITLVFLGPQIFKGNDAKRKSDIKRIQIAVEEYEKDRDCYPLPQYLACKPGTGLAPYLEHIACDPKTKASYYYEIDDSACPRWYRIYANLETETDPDISKLGCLSGCGPGFSYNYYSSSPNAPTVPQGGGGGGAPLTGFYGCRSGACSPISWDPTRPGPECDPNFQNPTCYNQCTDPMTECVPWK